MSAVKYNTHCNSVDINVNNKHTRALIDTGAHYSCINADFARRLRLHTSPDKKTPPKLLGANGTKLNVIGSATATISIGGYQHTVDFVVINGLYHNAIIVMHTLKDMNAVIDVSNCILSINNSLVSVPLIHRFSPDNIVRTVHSVTIAPFHEARLPVRISRNYTLGPSLIEPLTATKRSPLIVAKAFVDPHSHTTVCQIVNLGNKPHTVLARQALATIMPADLLSTPKTATTSAHDASVVNSITTEVTFDEKLKALCAKGFKTQPKDLTAENFKQLVELLYDYRDVFATEITDLPGVKDVEYNITLQPNARPTRPRQFRYPPHLREVIRKELSSWEKAGIIEEGDAR